MLTAIFWGKVADSPKVYGGRKMVLLIGTLGTSLGCLGYGFSSSFGMAMFWRIFAGCVNGLVGIIRTMISEITVERKYQSRAFLILPMSFNVAGILGPILGGWLADPATTLPAWFGPGAVLHSSLVEAYPFALPSLVNALALFAVFLAVLFGLEETSKSKKGTYDVGLHMAAHVKSFVTRRPLDYVYRSHSGYEQLELQDEKKEAPAAVAGPKKRTLPFRKLWTKNVIFTLLSQALYDFHLGAFTNMWTLFLSTPRPGFASPTTTTAAVETRGLTKRNLLWFAGGLGMPASTVGNATSILGVLGMLLQVVMYPPVHARLGTLRSFRYFLIIFPVAYLLAPFLAVMPQTATTAQDGSASTSVSTGLWLAIVVILFLHTSARTMTLPASIILLNNCSPHPSVLGTIHGLGQSVSAGFRTVGPIVGGWWYGLGLDWGMVAFSWWAVAGMSVLGWVASQVLYEGTGKEIELDDDDE